MKRLPLVLFPLLMLVTQALALDPNPAATGVRSMGMGGAWYAAGYGSEVVEGNPALLTRLHRSTLTIEGMRLSSHVDFSLSDADSDERETFGSGRHEQVSRVGFGVAQGRPGNRAALGIQYRLPWTQSLAFIRDEGKGGPSLLTAALAFEPVKGVALGASYLNLSGTLENNSDTNYGFELIGYRSPCKVDYEGETWQAGLTLDLGGSGDGVPIIIGLTYAPEWEYQRFIVEDDVTLQVVGSDPILLPGDSYDIRVEMPARIGGGIALTLFRRLTLTGDVEWYGLKGRQIYDKETGRLDPDEHEPWTVYAPTSIGNTDMTGWRVGAEFVMGDAHRALLLRGGYQHDASFGGSRFYDITSGETFSETPEWVDGLSAGVGIQLGHIRFDIAWIQLNHLNEFQYAPPFSPYNADPVTIREELLTDLLLAGMTLHF